MNFLKNSTVILFLLLYGCTSYKAMISKSGGVEIIATPDRFLPFCEKVVKDDNSISYGFMIFILDEEKTISTATGMLTSESACMRWKKEVENILINGNLITLYGFGGLEHPRVKGEYSYTFVKHGKFNSNGRATDFFSIRNNNGKCFALDNDRCL